jgi:glycosyltransferase involved in cell wall biosynthesis
VRIIIVSDHGTVIGGAAKVALVSALALVERGHEVHFVCATEPAPAVRDAKIHVHNLEQPDVWSERNPLRAAARGIWNRAAARYLHGLLADFDPGDSILHFHQWTKALSPSVIGAAAAAAVPCVFTMHDYFLFCPNGIYFDHALRRPCQRRPLSIACICAGCDSHSRAHKAVRVIRQLRSNAALRRIGQPLNLIHVSSFSRELARTQFPATTRHFILPNTTSLPKLTPVNVRDNRAFVYIGRFTPEKGPVLFARAAFEAMVPAIFQGEGPEEGLITEANPYAELRSWSSQTEVDALLQQARALVFPSLWHETSGLVVLESLSKGVPVICSEGTGAADWVKDGINGFLIKAGDVPGLRTRLSQIAADDDLAAYLGSQAFFRFWQEAPTLEDYADRLETIYHAVLTSGTGTQERGAQQPQDFQFSAVTKNSELIDTKRTNPPAASTCGTS